MVATIAAVDSQLGSCRQPVSRRQPVEVYRRRRIVAAGLAVATILTAWVGVSDLLGLTSDAGTGPTRPIAAHVAIVQPGDTLWSIALASGATGDIRPLVDQLSAEVHGRPLYVGERILVP